MGEEKLRNRVRSDRFHRMFARQMEKVRVGAPADGRDGGGGTRLRPALEKLEQWLVGFPCRVLIRHVYELTHGRSILSERERAAWVGSYTTVQGVVGAVIFFIHTFRSLGTF